MGSERRLVLVVEDEDAIREVMADVLEDRGFRVVSASNGAEALKCLEVWRPDAVVLDLLMPVMHGWAFMETYYERTRGAPVPNLLTISLDDARGRYRGAGHRHAPRQEFVVSPRLATPGLVPGPLEAGEWTLTLSAHTLVSPQCEVSIRIGAVTPSSSP